MLKPNNEKSKGTQLTTPKSPSNTPLFLHLPLTLSTNSFNSFLSTSNQAKIKLFLLLIHLDYLRISTTGLKKKSFDNLLAYLGLPVPCFENEISWHPDSTMPKRKKYQNSIQSNKGIIAGYTKRPKDKSEKPKYEYDIMIDFYGSYFANLSLIEQINLIYYLNKNYQPECHRIDVAMDDYSEELFPVLQILVACDMGNHFGFNKKNEDYLYCKDDWFVGTLYLGSRRSEYYVIIYKLHRYFVRWETELKQNKARELFDILASLGKVNTDGNPPQQDILKVLIDAALGNIDFRDKNSSGSPKNATKVRTKQLLFWEIFRLQTYSAIENIADSNYLKSS